MEDKSSELLVSAASLIVSCILAITYIYDRKNTRFTIQSSVWNEVLEWYFACNQILVQLGRSKVESARKDDLLASLSALIDKGRFYFPNADYGDELGSNNPVAFRGRRHLVLDFLVAAYDLHSGSVRSDRSSVTKLLSRDFTAAVFESLQPKNRNSMLSKVAESHYKRRSLEDYLAEQHHLAEDDILDETGS